MPVANVNGVDVFYRDEGPQGAPVLVLCHSLFFDHQMFEYQVAALSDRYRVVCYDFRDQGRSARTGLDPVDMDTLTEDAAAFIKQLGLDPCFFGGNSMGGFVALRLAARHPELLRGAVVMGSSGEAERKFEEFKPLVDGVREQGTEPFIDALMYIMFGDDYLADDTRKEERASWREYMLRLGPDIARSADGVIRRNGVLEELRGCSTPLLVIAGEQDHAYPPELSRNIVAAASNAELSVVSGAGHSVALERHDAVNPVLRRFLDAQTE